jgi:hypothetical protein
MKVYVVIIDYDMRGYNGDGVPDAVFLNLENAQAHANEINDGNDPKLAHIIPMEVADAEETNGYA